MAKTLLNTLGTCQIDSQYLFGQGYDGASNMSGRFLGVQTQIREVHKHKYAIYVHCAAHALNLVVTKATEVASIRNALGILEKMYTFFNTPKRKTVLVDLIEASDLEVRVKSLKRVSTTRWSSKFDATADFLNIAFFVNQAFSSISTWKNDAATDAILLQRAMDFEFLVSVVVANDVFTYLAPLSRELQKKEIDLGNAVDLAKDVLSELRKNRGNSSYFKTLYDTVLEYAALLNIEERKKRTVKVQTARANPDTESIEDYFRITIFNSFVDHVIQHLESRFEAHEALFKGFSILFRDGTPEDEELLKKTAEFYEPHVDSPAVIGELRLWKAYLKRKKIKPENALVALDHCDPEIYKNIYMLLKILATLPVSTSTAERSFSTLGRVKTSQRNTTGQVT